MKGNCPICNNTTNSILYTISSHHVCEYYSKSKKDYDNLLSELKELWGTDTCFFLYCPSCSFGFAQPFIAGNESIYSFLYSDNLQYPTDKWEFNKTISHLKEQFNSNQLSELKIVEYGAGSGEFLKKLHQLDIPRTNIFSTEYSDSGTFRIRSSGFECEQGDIISFNSSQKEKLDVFFMFQLLEHLDSIAKVFDSIDSVARNGSLLYIAVPNVIQREVYDKYNIHLDIPPIHIGRYKRESFERIAQRYKWKLLTFETEPQTYLKRIKKFLISRYWESEEVLFLEKQSNYATKIILRYYHFLKLIVKNFTLLLKLSNSNMGTACWACLKKLNYETQPQ